MKSITYTGENLLKVRVLLGKYLFMENRVPYLGDPEGNNFEILRGTRIVIEDDGNLRAFPPMEETGD